MRYIVKYFKVKNVRKGLPYAHKVHSFLVIRNLKDTAKSRYYLSNIIGRNWHVINLYL